MIERLFDWILSATKRLKYYYLQFRIRARTNRNTTSDGRTQNLAVYSDPTFGNAVGAWGAGTAWTEIQYLLVNCRGKILDIACGPCVPLAGVRAFLHCDVYGCDISEYLLHRALKLDVPPSKLVLCNATRTPYRDNSFDYSYSIGSLEHFTEEGISSVLWESHRITRYASFHQVPTSRSDGDEGWIVLDQSYFNNSVAWWLKKFNSTYPTVYILDSTWEDPISVGKWFVCMKA